MGNWTTVHIEGTVPTDELRAAKAFVDVGDDFSNFHCLCRTRGICGLGNWPAEKINRVGNLAERDYDAESVASTLRDLAKVAPNASLKVHVGGDYESDDCVATVKLEAGQVEILPPEKEKIPDIPQEQISFNLLSALRG